MLLLQICHLHIHDVNFQFHYLPEMLCWIWWLWGALGHSELVVIFRKPVWNYLNFVEFCIILLEAVIGRWVHCGSKGMNTVSNNTLKWCAVGNKKPKVCHKMIPHSITPPAAAWTIDTRQDRSMLSSFFSFFFLTNSDSIIWMLQKPKLIRPGNDFLVFPSPVSCS